MSLFKWGYGKHDTGYRAFTLVYSKLLNLDCYIIKYKQGASIPKHKDAVKDGRHYRLNWEFWKAENGGEFRCKTIWSLFGRVHFFRPDLEYHEVSEVTKGTRYILSIGKTLKNKGN